MANGRCRLHGGTQVSGIAHHSFKTGRYSQYLPQRLAAQYVTARDDPELHSLKDEIGIAQTRLQDLFLRLETSDLGHAWTALAEAWRVFTTRRRTGDVPGMQEALDGFEAIVRRGQQDYLLWQEIGATIKLVSGLRLGEHRRLVDLQAMMSALDAERLWGVTQLIVREAVIAYAEPDVARRILARIQADLAKFDFPEDRLVRAKLVGADPAAP